MDKMVSLPETEGSGIYLLISENRRDIYVGETGSFNKRIDNHIRNSDKDWFSYLMFFSRSHPLDKTELEYIEAIFIKSLKTLGYNMRNGNVGKTSNIDSYNIHPIQKYEANNFIEEVKYLLDRVGDGDTNIFNIDGNVIIDAIVDSVPNDNNVSIESNGNKDTIKDKSSGNTKPSKIIITDNIGNKISRKSYRKLYLDYIDVLSSHPRYEESLRTIALSGPKTFFSLDNDIPEDKKKWYSQISNGLYLYNNLSRKAITERLELIAEELSLEVKIITE